MVVLRAFILVLILTLPSASLHAVDKPAGKDGLATTAPIVDDSFDQGLFEDALPRTQPAKVGVGDWGLTMSADIIVNYTFTDTSRDKFKINYHIQLSGAAASLPTLIRGNATIKTDISGYLAKWTTGQCLLQVDVAAVPYEMNVAKESDDRLKISLQFKQRILEDWQSLCTFLDAPDRRFYTRGEPERWIAEALQKADPALDQLTAPIAKKDKTETKFKIGKYSVKDGSVGTADVEGSGSITIQPPAQLPEEKK